MRLPVIQLDDLSKAKPCPFYCLGSDKKYGCVIKSIVTEKTFNLVTPTNEKFSEEYLEDCGGEFENCCFSNLLWEKAFAAEALESDEATEDLEDTSDPTDTLEHEDFEEEEEEVKAVNIEIHKVENTYLVKSDVLVYPTNNLLQVDDKLLNRMSRGVIQKECDKLFQGVPKMGDVYVTSNGGDYPNGVKAKAVYHAVVAGESRLVNTQDIIDSTIKALILADQNGARVVTVIPADCGTYDIEATAYTQLSAIKTFLNTMPIENIEYIFVIMEDDESYEVFETNFSAIFNAD